MTDWSKAPDWAHYHATDANGNTYWYEKRPDKVKLHGWANQPTSRAEPDNTAFPYWEETLEECPKKLEVKVGGIYKMSNGKKAWILEKDGKKFQGAYSGLTAIYGGRWGKSGESMTSPEHDLLEEWLEERPKKLEIKVGEIYRTRYGQKAWALTEDETASDAYYPITGAIAHADGGLVLCSWKRNGVASGVTGSDDIIAEWKE